MIVSLVMVLASIVVVSVIGSIFRVVVIIMIMIIVAVCKFIMIIIIALIMVSIAISLRLIGFLGYDHERDSTFYSVYDG